MEKVNNKQRYNRKMLKILMVAHHTKKNLIQLKRAIPKVKLKTLNKNKDIP